MGLTGAREVLHAREELKYQKQNPSLRLLFADPWTGLKFAQHARVRSPWLRNEYSEGRKKGGECQRARRMPWRCHGVYIVVNFESCNPASVFSEAGFSILGKFHVLCTRFSFVAIAFRCCRF